MNQNEIEALQSRCKSFVRHLHSLESNDDGRSRAALAALRSGLRTKNGIAEPMMSQVVPHLGATEDRFRDPWFFVVGALFALHSEGGGSGSIGRAFSRLRSESDSIEKRFQQLISCEEEDLFRHLIQTVSLLQSKGVPVNWSTLLIDLTTTGWSHPDRTLQLKWARDFYRPQIAIPDATSAN